MSRIILMQNIRIYNIKMYEIRQSGNKNALIIFVPSLFSYFQYSPLVKFQLI